MTPTMPASPLEVETFDDTVLVTIGEGHLDEMTAEAVARHLYSLIQPSAPGQLLLDLRHVRYLTSTFLAALLTLRRLMKPAGGRLTLQNVNPLPFEVLEVTRLTQVFEVHHKGEADLPVRPA